MTDEQLTPEQGLMRQGYLGGLELAANVPDIAERERIWVEAGQAFRSAVERAAAAVPVELEPEPGTITTEVGTVRPITPGSHRWAPPARDERRVIE
jgi:hypothetical protein